MVWQTTMNESERLGDRVLERRRPKVRAPLLDVREDTESRIRSTVDQSGPPPARTWWDPIHVRDRLQVPELLLAPYRLVRHIIRNRRILTVAKLMNVAKVEVSALLHLRRTIGLPTVVKIETTNGCNTFCQLCPTGNLLQSRAKGLMPREEFERIVDEVKAHAYVIDLTQWGDPMIHPDIYDLIRYVHDARVYSYISTNFHGFQAGDADRLVASGLDELTVSLHGLTQESYEAYQPGKDLAEILERVKAVVAAKERAGARFPKIAINFVVTAKNEHEIEWVPAFAEELGVGFKVEPASMNLRFLHKDSHLQSTDTSPEDRADRIKAHLTEWLPKSSRSSEWTNPVYKEILEHGDLNGGQSAARGEDPLASDRKMTKCDWLWRKAVIHWDGAVVPCCGVYDKKWTFDSIKDKPFKEIWRGPHYLASRETFHGENAPDDSDAPETPCTGCPGWML